MNIHRRRTVLSQHPHQAALVDVFLHEHARHVGNADAFERSGADGERAVGAKIAVDADRLRSLRTLELPFVAEQIDVGDAVVRDQVGRRTWRTARAQICGRGHAHLRGSAKAPRDELRVGQLAETDRQIHAFLNQIDIAVAQHQINGQAGIQTTETEHRGHYVQLAKRHRGMNPQQPGRAVLQIAKTTLQIRYLVQDMAATLVILAAGFGRAQLPSGAIEQPHT